VSLKTVPPPQTGASYYCPICGARVTLLRAGSENLRPRCCGVDMVPVRGQPLPAYFCPICGTEVSLIKDNEKHLRLICCGVPMINRKN
jgi:endogenous inhibitor of DNA gyrase (YacG/DUF329 family)